MSKTPEEISKEVSDRIALASAAAAKQAEVAGAGGSTQAQAASAATPTPTAPAPSPAVPTLTQEQIDEAINRILNLKKKEKSAASTPPSIDWSKVSEREALDISNSLSIPVIEHEVPAYMDIRLADPEYECVWANRDQRRIGQLLAEGYEPLKKEHIAPSFPLPLKFDSEGLYVYQDVIALRVHKSILYGKRRRVVEQSYSQLRGPQALAKAKLAKSITSDPHLEEAFESGSIGYYDTSTGN